MRAKLARRLRRVAYGAGHHPGPVQYFLFKPKRKGHSIDKIMDGPVTMIVADERRRAYRQLKRAYLRGEFVL